MENSDSQRPPGEILVYQGAGRGEPVQVRLEGETVWLSQRLLADLYGVSVPTVNEHISNIYDDEELLPEATIRKFRIVQTEGSRQAIQMAHWEQFLDEFLASVELPVLANAGRVSQQEALNFASEQYSQFAEKRRSETQQEAEKSYIDDLKSAAQTLERERRQEQKRDN